MRFTGLSRDSIEQLALGRLADGRGGRPRPLLVVGDAGSGKTTLLESLVAAARGVVVLHVRPGRDDVPYAPLHAAVEAQLDTLAAGPRHDLLAKLHAATAPDADVGAARPHLLRLLGETLAALDELSPVMVCVDDVHAADTETAAAFWHLVQHVRERRIWVVGGLRGTAPDLAVDELVLLDRVAASGAVDVVELGPLTRGEVAACAADRLAAPVSDELVDLLVRRGAGNALYTTELLEWLSAKDMLLAGPAGRRPAPGAEHTIPERIGSFVVARFGALGPAALAVGTRLAVLDGAPLSRMPIVANLAGLPVREAEDAFDALVTAGLVIERRGRYRPCHDLVQDALYEHVGPAERRRLHELAAKLLDSEASEASADLVEVARHVRASAEHPDPGAARLIADAGDAVANRGPAMAVDWYRAALELLPADDPMTADIELSLSRALGMAGRYDEAADLAIRASATVDGAVRQRAVGMAAGALFNGQRVGPAAKILDQALDDPGGRSPHLLLQRAEVSFWSEDIAAARVALRDAEAMGLTAADLDLADVVRLHLDVAAADYEACARRAAQLRRRAMTPSATSANVAFSVMVHEATNGEPAAALTAIAAVVEAGMMTDIALALRAQVHYRCGRFDDAVAAAEASAAIQTGSGRSGDVVALATLVAVAVERERTAEVAGHVATLRAIPHNRGVADAAIARWLHARGDTAGAYGLLHAGIERYARVERRNFLPWLLAALVELALAGGDEEIARRAHERLMLQPRHPWAVAATISILLGDARMTGRREAIVGAVELADAHGLAADAATARGLLGALDGDRELLEAAHHRLGELGAVARQRAVAQQLRHANRRVRTTLRPGELTGTEAEIAGLVGQGHTNREIARITGLTTKTVETYVSRLLAKTGHTNRTKLAIAVALGDLPTGGQDAGRPAR